MSIYHMCILAGRKKEKKKRKASHPAAFKDMSLKFAHTISNYVLLVRIKPQDGHS